MLRNKLGNEVFWEGISAYLEEYQWKTAELSDLRRILEQRSNLSLSKFFDQWFEKGVGYPILKISVSYDAERDGLTTITVSQMQDKYREGFGFFDIEVEMAIEVDDDRWETYTLLLPDVKDSGFLGTSSTVIQLERKPMQVVVDPNAQLLFELSELDCGEDALIRSLRRAPTYTGRLRAANLLITSGTRRSMAAVCEALHNDPHWGIRSHIAIALSKTEKPYAREALLAALGRETNQRTLLSVVRGLLVFRDPDTVGVALAKFVAEAADKNHGYMAVSAALHALGSQRDKRFLRLLRDHLEDHALRGKGSSIHLGAIRGLGSMRSDSALDVLLRNAGKNLSHHDMVYSQRTRAAMMREIASCVAWSGHVARSKVFEYLKNICLTDEEYAVRFAAGSALARLSDVGHTESILHELSKETVNQDMPYIRAMFDDAGENRSRRHGDKNIVSALAMEKLQNEVRELQDQVQALDSLVKANFSAVRDDADGQSMQSAPNIVSSRIDAALERSEDGNARVSE